MSSEQESDVVEVSVMTEAELIHGVWPSSYAMKRLARLMNAPLGTARHWLYERFSPERRTELAVKLLHEMDEQDRRRSQVRRQLRAMAYGHGNQKMGTVGGSVATGETRLSRAARLLAKKAAE